MAIVMSAKLAGASKIVGVDTNPAKFNFAKELGATDCLNPKDFPRINHGICCIIGMAGAGETIAVDAQYFIYSFLTSVN